MPKIKFSYLLIDKIDSKTGVKIGEILRPYILIRVSLSHGNPTNLIDALVDSGSDRNLFPYRLGEIIGINFKKIKPTSIYGIGDIKFKTYPAKINIWVDKKKYETEADFCHEQQTPLLGRSGFFNLFKFVVFDENKHFIELEL